MTAIIKRNWETIRGGLLRGSVGPLAKKVRRSVAILRQRNKLTNLESAALRFVDKLAAQYEGN